MHFFAQGDTPDRYITLAQASAFVQQFPLLDPSLGQQCRIIGLQAQTYYATRPVELLHYLKRSLDARHLLRNRWATYWFARAPGTPMSRRDLAISLYSAHLQAAGQVAFALRTISADQLKPLLTLIDPPAGELQVDGQKIYVEQLLLSRTGQPSVELTGALVLSLDAEPSLQLLYLPTRQPALKLFNHRVAMERWLGEQSGLFQGVTQWLDDYSIGYRLITQPLQNGLTQLLEQQLKEKQNSLFSNPNSDLASHGAKALEAAERVDRQHRDNAFFAPPPPPLTEASSDEPAPIAFAGLTADLPLALRRDAIKQQQQALNTLLGPDFQGEPNDPRLLALTTSIDALHQAQQDASQAVSALFNQQPLVKLLELKQKNRADYTALYQARLKGLIHEADIQRQLGQISDNEYNLLMLLDTSKAPQTDRQLVSYTLTLSATERTNGQSITTRKELNGVLLITQAEAAQDHTAPHGLLLYWPGKTGGLLRLDSVQALEHWLQVDPTGNPQMTLERRVLSHDPFDYSLQAQLDDCVQQIQTLFRSTSAPEDAQQRSMELEKISLLALHELGVPHHAARELAYAQLLEQNQSSALSRQLPEWLGMVPAADKTWLKNQIEAYIQAFQQADSLLDLHLPPSLSFGKKRLDARLARDFSVQQPFTVQVDLPASVKHEQHFVSAPGAPGTPTKTVVVPSADRVSLSLEELALTNLDSSVKERMAFMKINVTSKSASERENLSAAINTGYLLTLIPELDLAQHYTNLIHKTFLGSNNEAVFTREHRLECLREPYRLMLKIQGRLAFLQNALTSDELQRFNLAIEARTHQAWQVKGDTLQLLPAFLRVGGKGANAQEGPSTLSGITFIHLKSAGHTLLYLPDCPDGRYLRRFSTLEAARMALYNECTNDTMVNYLAGRALGGSVESHASRINQAVLKNFNAIIGVDVTNPWAVTTSLADHLLHAQMGRLKEVHKATSRSNDDLYLENYALKGERAFNWIKMAMGVVPIIGTVVGLYDAWTSATQAVDAFRRGDHVQGMHDLVMILQSLIDAAMDVAGGVGIIPNAARTRTFGRHFRNALKSGGYVQLPSVRKNRHITERFKGYAYEKQVALGDLQPARHGLYRGVYRHADGNFIVRQDTVYQVELQNGEWRLSGNSQKRYKQPIALDDAGQWDTHFGVYGVLQNGGLAGGGIVLGHLADNLPPSWAQAIRERFPAWWTARETRRQRAINHRATTLGKQVDSQVAATKNLQSAYNQSDLRTREALQTTLEQSYAKDIEMAIEHSNAIDEVLRFAPAGEHKVLRGMKSRNAWIIADRYNELVRNGVTRLDDITKKRGINPPPTEQFQDFFGFLQTNKEHSLNILKELDQIDSALEQLNKWNNKINLEAQKAEIRSKGPQNRQTQQQINEHVKKASDQIEDLRKDINNWNDFYSPEFRQHQRTSFSIETFNRYDAVMDPSWLYLQERIQKAFQRAHRALQTHYSLMITQVKFRQRETILNDCIQAYTRFSLDLQTFSTGYPQHFDLPRLPELLTNLEKMIELARKRLGQAAPKVHQKPGASVRKVFETEDNQLLIGVESTSSTTGTKQYEIESTNGRTEIWEQKKDSKARLIKPPAATSPAAPPAKAVLVNEAQTRLQGVTAYQAKVEGFARRGMLPVSLEDMMISEAAELTLRANRIERVAPQEAIIEQLRNKAQELTTTGRAIRTRESLASQNPTDGMLDDLAKQGVVEVRKNSNIQNLGKRADGRTDYLQEYEVWDVSATNPRLLWYAHFHYNRDTPAFADFEKGHLKLPQHRMMTRADDPNLPQGGNIGKRSAALAHFPQA
ncbi:dermonecrotic toxin domain-containing protein [Pseudomonas fluorescens]